MIHGRSLLHREYLSGRAGPWRAPLPPSERVAERAADAGPPRSGRAAVPASPGTCKLSGLARGPLRRGPGSAGAEQPRGLRGRPGGEASTCGAGAGAGAGRQRAGRSRGARRRPRAGA